ncbi:MAG: NAD(P)-binding protein, partial [Thiogranum sp.]
GLARFESPRRIAEEAVIDPGDAEVIVIGMGRVGRVAYDSIRKQMGEVVLGVDMDDQVVDELTRSGRRVMRGSATDPDHWERVNLDVNRVKLILLAMPQYEENLFATQQLRSLGFSGNIAAIAKYPDEISDLQEAGVDKAYNLYAEAGAGFAEDVCVEFLPRSAS